MTLECRGGPFDGQRRQFHPNVIRLDTLILRGTLPAGYVVGIDRSGELVYLWEPGFTFHES